MPREQEKYYDGQDRYDRELERDEEGYYEEKEFGSIKLKIPPFQGKSDPEAYLKWEKKVELVFDCHNYLDLTKMRLTVVEFH